MEHKDAHDTLRVLSRLSTGKTLVFVNDEIFVNSQLAGTTSQVAATICRQPVPVFAEQTSETEG